MRHHARAAFTANGLPVTVHALHAGSVTVKRCHANCCLPERSPAPLRLLSILADRRFADPMPIWSYAIEHPEGLFVIDAGASASYNDPESWRGAPRRDSMIKSFIKLDVARGATVPDPPLKRCHPGLVALAASQRRCGDCSHVADGVGGEHGQRG